MSDTDTVRGPQGYRPVGTLPPKAHYLHENPQGRAIAYEYSARAEVGRFEGVVKAYNDLVTRMAALAEDPTTFRPLHSDHARRFADLQNSYREYLEFYRYEFTDPTDAPTFPPGDELVHRVNAAIKLVEGSLGDGNPFAAHLRRTHTEHATVELDSRLAALADIVKVEQTVDGLKSRAIFLEEHDREQTEIAVRRRAIQARLDELASGAPSRRKDELAQVRLAAKRLDELATWLHDQSEDWRKLVDFITGEYNMMLLYQRGGPIKSAERWVREQSDAFSAVLATTDALVAGEELDTPRRHIKAFRPALVSHLKAARETQSAAQEVLAAGRQWVAESAKEGSERLPPGPERWTNLPVEVFVPWPGVYDYNPSRETVMFVIGFHPDDDSSKLPAAAQAEAEKGNNVILVRFTGYGAGGAIQNDALDTPSGRRNFTILRGQERDRASARFGACLDICLGYEDQGMEALGWGTNNPLGMNNAPPGHVADRLHDLLVQYKPSKVVTAQTPKQLAHGYNHPDHVDGVTATIDAVTRYNEDLSRSGNFKPTELYCLTYPAPFLSHVHQTHFGKVWKGADLARKVTGGYDSWQPHVVVVREGDRARDAYAALEEYGTQIEFPTVQKLLRVHRGADDPVGEVWADWLQRVIPPTEQSPTGKPVLVDALTDLRPNALVRASSSADIGLL